MADHWAMCPGLQSRAYNTNLRNISLNHHPKHLDGQEKSKTPFYLLPFIYFSPKGHPSPIYLKWRYSKYCIKQWFSTSGLWHSGVLQMVLRCPMSVWGGSFISKLIWEFEPPTNGMVCLFSGQTTDGVVVDNFNSLPLCHEMKKKGWKSLVNGIGKSS